MKKTYDTNKKAYVTDKGKAVATDIYALLKKTFPLTITSDGFVEYDTKDLSTFEITQLDNYLLNL